MVIESIDEGQEALKEAISRARWAVGFTGAGISTESGIPDFRSPNSPWMRNRPIDFNLFVSDAALRREAWRRKFAMDDLYKGAQPSRGHRALADWVATGRMRAIITQNIDGLHQASGVRAEQIIELHGNGTYAKCLTCGQRYELSDVREVFESTGDPPCCACGGMIKSATISFGQAMPEREMARAAQEAANCDLFIAIGSSLIVYPAAGFPTLARRSGATLIIVNAEETPLDGEADLVLRGDIGDFFATAHAR